MSGNNFYDFGGTSLLLVQLLMSIHDVFGVELTLSELNLSTFNIAILSEIIEQKIAMTHKNEHSYIDYVAE